MSGTTKGAKEASKTNMRKYGKDFYSKIGSKGGKVGGKKGFAVSGLASSAGKLGGKNRWHESKDRQGGQSIQPLDKDEG